MQHSYSTHALGSALPPESLGEWYMVSGERLCIGPGCLKTMIIRVDNLLFGGLERGAITELVGLSGAGKTQVSAMNFSRCLSRKMTWLSILSQLCMYAAVSAACDSHHVIYFDCNGSAAPTRMVEMAIGRLGQVNFRLPRFNLRNTYVQHVGQTTRMRGMSGSD